MKKLQTIVLAGLLFGLVEQASAMESAEALFTQKCAMCHTTTRPTDRTQMVAPPVMGVLNHVKMRYPHKADAVAFMVDYVLEPSKEKAVCMPQKIARFGLMPSQKGAVSKEELERITSWLYDNYPPKGFRGRGQGKGQGMGQGNGRGQGMMQSGGM